MNKNAFLISAGLGLAGWCWVLSAAAQPVPSEPLPSSPKAEEPALPTDAPGTGTPGDETSNPKEMVAPAPETTASMPPAEDAPKTVSDTPIPQPEPKKPARRARPHRFQIQFGLRTTLIPNEGYDPYAEGNGLAQAAFTFAYSPWRTLPFSVYGVGEWNIGGASSAMARGADSALIYNRLALGVEGRYEPISRLYMYLKVMPAAINVSGTFNNYGVFPTLEGDAWTWGLDTTAGAAIRVGNIGRDETPKTTFWFMLDLGYSFAGEANIVLRPTANDDSLEGRRFGGIPLTPFTPSGVLWRFAFSAAF